MLRLLAALCTCTCTATATYGCNNGQRAADGSDLGHRPAFHFYPDTIESQDISGPIKINSTWHVFMDCVPEGCPALVQPVQDKPLSWCHFSSPDLVHWAEHPIAIAPDRPFDGSIIDTGAVFQHPNGTVLAIYATSNITSNLHNGTFDGDICFARSTDPELLVWEKLCDQPSARIVNPTCHWCRETCPESCQHMLNSTLPSPFPGIGARMAHRDPVAPWLDACGDGSKEQCWYAMSGSGGKIPGHEELGVKSAMVLWKTDYLISTEWTFVKIFWNSPGSIYSCPDFFRLPGSDHYVFGSLDEKYWVGSYGHDAKGFPQFDGAQENGTAAAPSGSFQLGIWKTGGEGPNNVMASSGRRVLFGTIGWTNGQQLPSLNPLTTSLHVGSIAALPRDLTVSKPAGLTSAADAAAAATGAGGAAAGGVGVSMAFVPELQALRDNSTHVHRTAVAPNASARTVLFRGRQAEIIVTFAAPPAGRTVSTALGVSVLSDPSAAPAPPPPPPPTPPPHSNCTKDPFAPCYGWDRGGEDALDLMNYKGTVEDCEGLCLANSTCMAWTWCGPGSAGPGPRCCLKSAVPNQVAPYKHMACGIAPRAKGHIPPGAMNFNHPPAPPPPAVVHGTGIVYDPVKKMLSVGTHSNPGHDTTPLSLRPGEALTLHVYLDGFLVEVVANNRASLATSVPMPLNGDAVLPLGDMEVAAFDAWALKSIWA